ncbi:MULTISPECIES: branched-chain amino acid ABC transporter permease [unclassified Diaminobutyricimonas]|uniref:branched-chain amino acid ABC transporter permease n=1 Tax=unclassified Diaminobutyricimonas TaxID=2643261 RepID=UPI0012F48B33|nr:MULTISPECIES: branched-chain amino acid ABC transporter permease [unclassified Diaminobutyricimonas]
MVLLVLTALLAALIMLSAAPPAHADEVGAEEPYKISGNVQLDGEPLEDVLITVTGDGVDLEVETDAEGQWRVGVPERAEYTVTLVESTLPEGIAVVDETGADDSPNEKEVEIGPGGRVTMNFFIGEGERNVTSFFDQLVSRLFNGLNFGLMLGLAAVGASLVYGTTGLANFAHAEMVTFGAIVAFLLGTNLGVPLLAAIPLAVIISGVFGWAMDAGLWRPLRHKGLGLVQLMIVSIGLSLTLRYVFQYYIGGGTLQLPGSAEAEFNVFGAVTMSWIDVASMAMSVIVLVVFALWLLYSRMGKATRAISDNPSLAAASGIDVDRVVRWVWIISAAMAGLAGILYAYFRPGIKWDMGAQILLLVFASITLGGLGTAFGALLGSIIVGVLVEVSTLWIPSDLKYVGALGLLVVILLVRPQGILGRKERIG